MDWQDIWQDLEDVYDKIREKKLAGATFRERRFNRAVDNVLDLLNSAQDEAEGRGAVPVEPVEDLPGEAAARLEDEVYRRTHKGD